jgi:hypothetical protein
MRPILCALLAASLARADATVFGQIVDSENRDGGEIEFAFLRLKEPDDMDGEPVRVRSDRTGRFSATLAPGAWRIGDIRKPRAKDPKTFEANYARDLIDVGSAPQYDLGVIALEKTGTYVSGRVTRAGQGVPHARVGVFDPGAGAPTGVFVETGDAGGFELQLNDVRSARRVTLVVMEEKGSVYGGADVDLWKPGRVDLEVPEEYHELLVDLAAPGETLLYLHPAGDPAPYARHTARGSAKVTIEGVAPGKWTLTAVCAGAMTEAEVTVPAPAAVAIAIPEGARHRLEGRVAVSGLAPAMDARRLAVVARPAAGGSPGYLWSSLGADGSFAFPGLATGAWEITICYGTVRSGMRYFAATRSQVLQSPVELKAPRKLDLKADLSGFKE